MKTLRLAIACLALAMSMPSVLHAQNAGAGSLERTLTGNQWDVETERGQRAWGDIRFRAGGEFSTMNGPQGNWKVTGERTVELGRYVVEFAPGLESFVVTEKGAGKVATGKRKGARAAADLSPIKTTPVAPPVLPQPPVPLPLTPELQTAKRNAEAVSRHAQEVATQIAKLQEPFATIAAEAEKATKDVMANYLSALDQLQGQKAAAGDIDGVVALKQERDRVTNNVQPTAAELQAMSAPVRKLRATYEADTKKAADEAVRRDKFARSSYLANLEALQKRMNAAGEIEQGLLVKGEKDRFIEQLAAGKGAIVAPQSLVPTPLASGGAGGMENVTGKKSNVVLASDGTIKRWQTAVVELKANLSEDFLRPREKLFTKQLNDLIAFFSSKPNGVKQSDYEELAALIEAFVDHRSPSGVPSGGVGTGGWGVNFERKDSSGKNNIDNDLLVSVHNKLMRDPRFKKRTVEAIDKEVKAEVNRIENNMDTAAKEMREFRKGFLSGSVAGR